MIDRNHDLPVVRQCQFLALARSTAYYTPKPTSTDDLALMRRMDELHLEFPFAGSRKSPVSHIFMTARAEMAGYSENPKMTRVGKLLNYDELLEKYPEWVLWETAAYHQETTPEATESARISRWKKIGYVIKFIQDHGLTRRVLCETAPDIPENFSVYLRDITPEGLEFYRTGYKKWLKRFERDMNANPSDVCVMEKSLAEMRATAGLVPVHNQSSSTTEKKTSKLPGCSQPSIPFMKYDDATWHSEGEFPADLDPDAGATHIGIFFAWMLLHDMASTDHAQIFSVQIEQLRKREISPGAYLLQVCDGKLTSDDLSEDGNAFARSYYDLQKGNYLRDYERYLAGVQLSTYHVPDSWDSYDKLTPVIEKRYETWKQNGS